MRRALLLAVIVAASGCTLGVPQPPLPDRIAYLEIDPNAPLQGEKWTIDKSGRGEFTKRERTELVVRKLDVGAAQFAELSAALGAPKTETKCDSVGPDATAILVSWTINGKVVEYRHIEHCQHRSLDTGIAVARITERIMAAQFMVEESAHASPVIARVPLSYPPL